MMSFIFRTIKVVRLLEKTSPILFLKSQSSLLIKPLLFVKKNTNKKQYRYYCIAKEPVLRCNIGTFATQNNGCCNALIFSLLSVGCTRELSLQTFCFLFVLK